MEFKKIQQGVMFQYSSGKQRECIIEATTCKQEMNRKKAFNRAQAKGHSHPNEITIQTRTEAREEREEN